MYGIPEGTWLAYNAAAAKGPGHLQMESETAECVLADGRERRAEVTSAKSECVSWWVDFLIECCDFMPNESPPVIKHPLRIVWESMYKVSYLEEARTYFECPPLQQKDGKAPGSWFTCRTEALVVLSLEEFGLLPGANAFKPKCLYSLVARPNHSNFPDCVVCAAGLEIRLLDMKNREPTPVRSAHRALQVKPTVQ